MTKRLVKMALEARVRKRLESKAMARKKQNVHPERPNAMEQSSSYQYTPLHHPDSIRLLALYPEEFASPIQISLAEVRSREHPQYEALSYTWAIEDGDCSRSSQIKCDDGKVLLVTKNCELALRYLRKQDLRRTLWVDAISINQEDTKERGHQVRIMRDVYANATEVLIWLGESSKELGIPLLDTTGTPERSNCVPLREKATCLKSTSGLCEKEPDNVECRENDPRATVSVSEIFLESLARMMAEVRHMQRADQDPKSSPLYQEMASQLYEGMAGRQWNVFYQGFGDIVDRRWWSRVWVVQEVFAARSATLVCSKKCIPYQDFFDWYQILIRDHSPKSTMIWRYFGSSFEHFNAQSWTRATKSGADRINRLFQTLCVVRSLQASNPRDKIFGVLGLSDHFKSILPTPDYDTSATKLFTNVAKTILVKTESLDILYEATTGTPVSSHPSWVPDWSQLPIMMHCGLSSFSAAHNSEAIFAFSLGDRELQVKGKRFDGIGKIHFADLTAYGLRGSLEDRIPGFLRSCEAGFTLTTYPTGESVEEALWRTFCWNLDNDGYSRASPERGDGFREWHRLLISNDDLAIIVSGMLSQKDAFELIINQTTPLCTTAKGFLAAVPCTTEVGDCIAILSGGNIPFVLRPTGDHYYRLVGPCYVHGIMDGEAFPEDAKDLEWFSIH
ncbi:hypothetical protein N431DRAFT_550864 [Stipitochalara longipes BDJ]|nr:hypothetical protein N431DRAFT_550864 [Stipitochalara longipes BDJ]